MNDIISKLGECVEFGKINLASPYPPTMKGLPGADELTREALENGISPQSILSESLIPAMNRVGNKFYRRQNIRTTDVAVGQSDEQCDEASETLFPER